MKVLLPVDGSENSRETLAWASTQLCKDVEFYLLTVISEPMVAEYKVEDAKHVLDEARAALEASGCRVEKSEYITGDPVKSICKAADDFGVDQVLMGSHGRSGLARMLLGSVSEGVLEHCSKPVIINRRKQNSTLTRN